MKNIQKKDTSKNGFIKLCILLIVIAGLLVLSVFLFPYFTELADEEKRNELVEYIRGNGALGILILMGIQILQVIIAVIPGEIIEVIAGIIYGTIGGYIICTIGVLISTMIVYFTVRKLGVEYIEKNFSAKRLEKFKFLQDSKKLETIIFLLFFLPATPKDMLTYIVPFTKIKPLHFFVVSSLGRIPSILTSTFAGANLIEGEYLTSIIVFAITGSLGILGILFKDKIILLVSKLKK